MSAAGCSEVIINKQKGEDSNGKRFKKSKKGELNYCPDPPEGQCPENMEEKPEIMKAEMQKKDPDHQLLEDLMAAMFSLDHWRTAIHHRSNFPVANTV